MKRLFVLLTIILWFTAPVYADPFDNGNYQVSYAQDANGLWHMNLSFNHPAEIARLGTQAEIEQGFPCQHEAVNHFYFLLGRLYHITLAPFPAPPGGC